MDNNQTLELQIKTKAQEAKTSVDILVKSLTNIENVLTNVYLELGHIENKTDSAINQTLNVTKNINKMQKSTDKATESTNKLGNAFKNIFTFVGAKKITLGAVGWINEAIDYTEQLNLFNVVFDNVEKNGKTMFSKLGSEATKFQYKLNEAFGTNKTQTLYMQGIFQSMGETVGIDDKHSSIMSETMSKLTFDLASLYNKTESATAEAIRAGVYAGQTKPLRSFGIDVTQMSMQPILNELGIDKQVKNMSQAEKEILRYIATLKQAKIAMGDLANTIESPSNQMKVFRQQLIETKVAFSSLFIGTFAKALPYANAFLMVIKEISLAIATMFGIELKDYNSGIASQEGIYDGIEESADNASKAVKELKRQTLGFDEIHNINENNDNGNGTSASGGIDQRLLDAITGYDNGMDKVRMKATEIRDKIMEWLGFTKEIDPLTNKISFKFKEGYSNLKLMGGIVATLISFKLWKRVSTLSDRLKDVGDSTSFMRFKLKASLPILLKTGVAIAGISGVVFGSKGTYNAMKEMTKQAQYGGEQYKKYTVSVLGTVSGATALGAVIGGPLGAAIGALTGTIVAGTSALLGYKKGMEELAKEEIFGNVNISTSEWRSTLDNLNISLNDNTARFKTLKNDLSSLNTTFENNVNKMDYYGLKFGKLSEKISKEDSINIKNSIKEMCDSTISMIDSTTTYGLELVSATFKQGTKLSEEEQKKILKSITSYGKDQKEELKNAQDNITRTYDNAIKTRGYLTDEEYKYISEQLQKIRELTNSQMSKSQTEIEYYKAKFADKNQKLDEESYANYKNALDDYHKEKLEAIENTYNQELNYAKSMIENNKDNQDEWNQYISDAYTNRNKSINSLDEELNKHTEKVISSLKEQYNTLLTDNSEYAKKQKSEIEKIFTKLDINYTVFENAGKKAISYFTKGFGSDTNFTIKSHFGSGGSSGGRMKKGGIYSNGSWKNIPQYANGGSPSHGTLFWAGEAGAEVVAHANGKTEVLNQSQIASAIYSATLSAMSQVMGQYNGQTSEINVHVHTDEGTVVDRINQITNQTGMCPINIPI